MCRVEKIYYKPVGSSEGFYVNSAYVVKGYGIEGDKHGGKPGRHLSILKTSTRNKISGLLEQGICTLRFKENILISGEMDIKKGQILKIGDVIIKITATRKKCFQECSLFNNQGYCPMDEVVFTEVIESGVINTNDEIKII
jgi:MOSC domain-containing protein YiiM